MLQVYASARLAASGDLPRGLGRGLGQLSGLATERKSGQLAGMGTSIFCPYCHQRTALSVGFSEEGQPATWISEDMQTTAYMFIRTRCLHQPTS